MGWWVSAKRGDKVVCIDDEWIDYDPGFPRRGQVLEIYDLASFPDLAVDGCDVYLNFTNSEWGYLASCFRPVTPKSTETGMKIIRSILDRAPVKEDA